VPTSTPVPGDTSSDQPLVSVVVPTYNRTAYLETAVSYPTPLHLQPALAGLGLRRGELPRAEAACAEVLAVPAHAELTPDEVGRVCEEVRAFFRG